MYQMDVSGFPLLQTDEPALFPSHVMEPDVQMLRCFQLEQSPFKREMRRESSAFPNGPAVFRESILRQSDRAWLAISNFCASDLEKIFPGTCFYKLRADTTHINLGRFLAAGNVLPRET